MLGSEKRREECPCRVCFGGGSSTLLGLIKGLLLTVRCGSAARAWLCGAHRQHWAALAQNCLSPQTPSLSLCLSISVCLSLYLSLSVSPSVCLSLSVSPSL